MPSANAPIPPTNSSPCQILFSKRAPLSNCLSKSSCQKLKKQNPLKPQEKQSICTIIRHNSMVTSFTEKGSRIHWRSFAEHITCSIPKLKTKCALRGYFQCFNIRNCKLKCWKIPTYFASPPKGTRFINCQPIRKIRNQIRQQSIVIYAERYSKRTLPWFNDQYNT